MKASGASDFRGGKLLVEKAELEASGASDVVVNAGEIVSQKASGASDIVNVR